MFDSLAGKITYAALTPDDMNAIEARVLSVFHVDNEKFNNDGLTVFLANKIESIHIECYKTNQLKFLFCL